MIFTYKTLEILAKTFFSAVIVQLFVMCLGAGNGCYSGTEVLSMLEYPAASSIVALGGIMLLQYVIDNQ